MNGKELKNCKELMISRNGKPTFAMRIPEMNDEREASYVYMENGDIKFSSSWFGSITPFAVGDRSHEIAKEMFTVGLQAAIKLRVMDLMQIQSILKDINLDDCMGSVLQDNTRLLLEVKESISQVKTTVKETVSNMQSTMKGTVESAIVETMQPVAIKKAKRFATATEQSKEGAADV